MTNTAHRAYRRNTPPIEKLRNNRELFSGALKGPRWESSEHRGRISLISCIYVIFSLFVREKITIYY